MDLPDVEDWVACYLARHRRHEPSIRALRVLHERLRLASSAVSQREIALLAKVHQSTVARVTRRLVTLGVISADGGGEWQPGVGRKPLRYTTHWPPRPP